MSKDKREKVFKESSMSDDDTVASKRIFAATDKVVEVFFKDYVAFLGEMDVKTAAIIEHELRDNPRDITTGVYSARLSTIIQGLLLASQCFGGHLYNVYMTCVVSSEKKREQEDIKTLVDQQLERMREKMEYGKLEAKRIIEEK